ncbi:heterokaryon incompatibility protein-domain-containing protein [Bisporella sp. PMI_857]|nr:heterokaryon incompatibility protein-domain-containing protein [Bisporella sp. PMI_857]
MDPYQYSPIEARGEIRLLTLNPGSSSDDINLQLHHEDLSNSEPTPFEALSYVWGSVGNPVSVRIGTGSLFITRNLAIALKYFRYEDRPRVLWVDAICINQRDSHERSQQVLMMGSIYKQANRVVAWIGPSEDDSTYALEVLETLSSKIEVDWFAAIIKPSALVKDDPFWANYDSWLTLDERSLNALDKLFHRQWFERLWARQEIRLGKSQTAIKCGLKEIPWQSFRNAIYLIRLRVDTSPLDARAISFHDRLETVFELADQPSSMTFQYLRGQTRRSKCGDPRDKIYAILSLLHPRDIKIGIVPDYSKATAEVYRDLTIKYTTHFRSLNMLSSCELGETLAGTPSWVPNWSAPRLSKPLWTIPQQGIERLVDARISFNGADTLQILGIFCATIDNVQRNLPHGDSIQAGKRIRNLLPNNVLTGTYRTGESSLEAYCRTLCCNDFEDKFLPPRPSFPSFDQSLAAITSLLETEEWSTEGSKIDRYLWASVEWCKGRSFFSTKEGYIGLGPIAAEPGDKICTVLGCWAPMVLRRTEDMPLRQYRVVGECYAHGLMEMQALLGELPIHTRQVVKFDAATDAWLVHYMNRRSPNIQGKDERLQLLLSNMVNNGYLKEANVDELRRNDAVDILRKSGIIVESFDLV